MLLEIIIAHTCKKKMKHYLTPRLSRTFSVSLYRRWMSLKIYLSVKSDRWKDWTEIIWSILCQINHLFLWFCPFMVGKMCPLLCQSHILHKHTNKYTNTDFERTHTSAVADLMISPERELLQLCQAVLFTHRAFSVSDHPQK